jgi:putative nucleotidyltransferase with HDIG domain
MEHQLEQLKAHQSRVTALTARFGSPELCSRLDEAVEFAALEGQSVSAAIGELMEDLTGPVGAAFRSQVLPPACHAPSTLPVMPRAVSRLLRTTEDQTTGRELESIAGSDPVLSAALLAAANSALYGKRLEISTLRESVLRLGVPESRKLLFASCMSRLFASSALRSLWHHSQAVADAAWELAGLCEVEPETAYLAGLLHDIGRLGFSTFPAHFRDAEESWLVEGFPVVYAESMVYGKDHAELGAELLREWALPQEIVEAVRCHHRPECNSSRLTAVVCLAENLQHSDEDLWSEMRRQTAMERAGIVTAQLARRSFKRVCA